VVVKNKGGCKATDELTVSVLCNGANMFIPNTFSPNQDGVNDLFYPRGSGIFTIKRFKVFSRWGEVIFEQNNFNANDLSKAWDGTFKGKKLDPDVYIYTVDVMCENFTVLSFKGNVALIK
jgi:gliding motility-associated-like protein